LQYKSDVGKPDRKANGGGYSFSGALPH